MDSKEKTQHRVMKYTYYHHPFFGMGEEQVTYIGGFHATTYITIACLIPTERQRVHPLYNVKNGNYSINYIKDIRQRPIHPTKNTTSEKFFSTSTYISYQSY